jgi:hypothetical protein
MIASVCAMAMLPGVITVRSAAATETGGLRGAAPAARGARLWVSRYGGPGNAGADASAMAVSPAGGAVYVTGSSTGVRHGMDYATAAYDAATGAQLWASRYVGPSNERDLPTSMAVSPDGSTVFVTGFGTGDLPGSQDYVTVAYNAATGAQLWAERYNGPGNGDDRATSMAVSPEMGPPVRRTPNLASLTNGRQR